MKAGDLVKHGETFGLVVDTTERKAWRVHERGFKIDWNKADPEPHAVVMHECGTQITIPCSALELVGRK